MERDDRDPGTEHARPEPMPGGAGSRDSGAERDAEVMQKVLDGAACVLVPMLERCLERLEAEERSGPHVVILRGMTDRCFGPFDTRDVAVAAALAEAVEWRREFPQAIVTFHVAPLLATHRIGTVG